MDIHSDIITLIENQLARKLLESTTSFIMSIAEAKYDADRRKCFTDMEGNLTRISADFFSAYIGTVLTDMDESLYRSPLRKSAGLKVIKKDERTLTTTFGDVKFIRRLYRDETEGKSYHLLDRFLGITRSDTMTNRAKAAVLSEAVESSYRKGAAAVDVQRQRLSSAESGRYNKLAALVSPQTVQNLVHSLQFTSELDQPEMEAKRKVKVLFIDADEDHVKLQYLRKKGDLEPARQENKYTRNCSQPRLVYVYEGVRPVNGKVHRYELINPHYIAGLYDGSYDPENTTDRLWDEVWAYIDHTYDVDSLEAIYLGGDGGNWIKKGEDRIGGLLYVLDEFHLRQALNRMTSHLEDSQDDAKQDLLELICNGTKKQFEDYSLEVLLHAEPGSATAKRVEQARNYVLNAWDAAKRRLALQDDVLVGCHAESHVYHVLANRMSTRPMAWTIEGVDKMARLRAYYWNGGTMLKLVEAQPEKDDLPAAAGAENETVLSLSKVLASEGKSTDTQKYAERMQASLGCSDASMDTALRKLSWKIH